MCDCIEKTNQTLAAHNTRLVTQLVLEDGKLRRELMLPTAKVNKNGQAPLSVVPLYCPICGVKVGT